MKNKEQGKYGDMLHLSHHVSVRHSPMPLSDRAAQFSPFAALTGHDAAIRETARLTDSFVELDEEQKERLDERLRLLLSKMTEAPSGEPAVRATYFQPDTKKSGGSYVSICGKVKKIDRVYQQIFFTDGTNFPLEYLFSLEGELFGELEDV